MRTRLLVCARSSFRGSPEVDFAQMNGVGQREPGSGAG